MYPDKSKKKVLKNAHEAGHEAAVISMSTRSSMCLPEHGDMPNCHILSSL